MERVQRCILAAGSSVLIFPGIDRPRVSLDALSVSLDAAQRALQYLYPHPDVCSRHTVYIMRRARISRLLNRNSERHEANRKKREKKETTIFVKILCSKLCRARRSTVNFANSRDIRVNDENMRNFAGLRRREILKILDAKANYYSILRYTAVERRVMRLESFDETMHKSIVCR